MNSIYGDVVTIKDSCALSTKAFAISLRGKIRAVHRWGAPVSILVVHGAEMEWDRVGENHQPS
jgi:hypothetical protein